MQLLIDRIEREAKHLGNGIVKIDSFMNHQVDPILMRAIGNELSRRFIQTKPTKILTAEASGIAPALVVGMSLEIPIIFARNYQPVTMASEPYHETSASHTHGYPVELLVSTEYLLAKDRVLIIDDFLASSKTIRALCSLVQQSHATLVGIGAVIEKAYLRGRERLQDLGVPIESLAVIERCEGDLIIMRENTSLRPSPPKYATK